MSHDEIYCVKMGSLHGCRAGALAVAGLLTLIVSGFATDAGLQRAFATDATGTKVLDSLPLAKLRSNASRADLLKRGGGNQATEESVAAALGWIARHQSSDGSWNLVEYSSRCMDGSCASTPANAQMKTTPAATAMGLLPLLAAGHTHKTQGPYRKVVQRGLQWLVQNQQPGGDLANGAAAQMYSHGMASLALCDAYALTADPEIGRAAQKAIDFIEAAQDPATGGWRYVPRQGGDTSVLGWQLMSLEVGQFGWSEGSASYARRGQEMACQRRPGRVQGKVLLHSRRSSFAQHDRGRSSGQPVPRHETGGSGHARRRPIPRGPVRSTGQQCL